MAKFLAALLSTYIIGTNGDTMACGSALELDATDGISVDVSFDVDASMAYITLTGPDSQWFGVGFGSSTMENTYAIIVDGAGAVTERKLGSSAGSSQSGTELTASVTESSNDVANSIRTVVLTRAIAGTGDDYYTFDGSNFDVIWGTTAGESSFQGHTSKGSDSYMCDVDLTDDMMMSSEVPMMEECGVATLDSTTGISLGVSFDTDDEMAYITLEGPDGQWFGVGFGSTTMDGTYAIIVDGTGAVEERTLGSSSGSSQSGTVLTASVTVESTSVEGDVRTVVLTRAITNTESAYYSFDGSDVSVIWGTTTDESTFQGHTSKGAETYACDVDLSSGDDDDDMDSSNMIVFNAAAFVVVFTLAILAL